MAELAPDVVEQILVRLDVKDLIRSKSVCKSWQSFISSPRFVKAHLNHTYDNDHANLEFVHRRIVWCEAVSIDDSLCCNHSHIVGSCNGLVCVSPVDFELVVTNPSTREVKKLQTPPFRPHKDETAMVRNVVCWGFGYDSAANDYKVIAGFRKRFSNLRTLFYALTLKSNIWKVIGEVRYRCSFGVNGILCDGALHWFMSDAKKKVIISLDLSTQEFKEIPQPTNEEYECHVFDELVLGLLEGSLCIYSFSPPLSSRKWIMKNNKWELYNDHCETKFDVAHYLVLLDSHSYDYSHDGCSLVPHAGGHVRASIFVKSLVSPHPRVNNNNVGQTRNAKRGQEGNEGVERDAKVNIRKKKNAKKRRTRLFCKHKKPLIWI